MSSSQSRRQIIRTCKSRGWTVHPEVLKDLEALGLDELQSSILPVLPSSKGRCITPAVWNEFLLSQQESNSTETTTGAKAQPIQPHASEGGGKVQVVSAFAAPNIVYDQHRKQFRAVERKGHVLGNASDKVDMLLQRYHWLHQRVLNHPLFRPTNLHERPHALTPVASLLGGNYSQRLVLLLAIVVRTSDTEFALEDPTGQVAADWSQCTQQDSLVTEHSIILVEGTFYDQVFTVRQLRQPLHDDNNRLRVSNLPPASSSPESGIPVTAVVHGTAQFQRVMAKEHPDILIVMLKTTSELADVSHFGATNSTTLVVVPPATRSVWPMPALSSNTTTNPTRVVLPHQNSSSTSNLVALNDPRLCQQWHASALFRAPAAQWWRTALDQGSMLPPGPTAPVYWNCCPRLYPLPEALVVVDDHCKTVVDEYCGCQVLKLGNDDEEYGLYDEDGWRVGHL